jgi:hypothetical protein
MRQEQLSWNQQNGWVVTQTWRGPSGAGKATRDAWLAEWVTVYGNGYVSLTFNDSLPMLDGEAVCEASIVYGSNESGEPLPDTDPEYGLIERRWTLSGVDQQLSIRENPRVEDLAEYKQTWPGVIRDWVVDYSRRNQEKLGVWDPTTGSQRYDPPPWAVPIPYYDVGAGPVLPPETLIALANTLAERIETDPQALWTTTGYMLRKTEQVTSWSTLVVSHLYVNRVLDWWALIAQEPTLPSTGLIQTGGLEGMLWLVGVPEVVASSGGNYELSQSYTSIIRPTPGSKRERDIAFDYGEIVYGTPPP